MRIVPTAGWLLVVELSNLAMYAFSRVILGAYRSPDRGGPVRGAGARAQPALRAGRALAVPVVPTASRYVAAGDERRLRELAVRGTRYTLALFVPLCVTLMALAEPILEVWLGDRYGERRRRAHDPRLLLAALGGARRHARASWSAPGGRATAGRIMVVRAAANLALSLVLTPELGLEGPALGTAIPFVARVPAAAAARAARVRRPAGRAGPRAWLPAYLLGRRAGRACCVAPARGRSTRDTLPRCWRGGRRGAGLLGRLLRARARPGRARARARARSATCRGRARAAAARCDRAPRP